MMKVTKLPDSGYHVGAKKYKFDLFDGIEPARLSLRDSCQTYWFTPSGSVNSVKRCDETAAFEKWQKKEENGAVIFTRNEKSVLWKHKTVTFICREDVIELFMTVEGQGDVEDVRFLRNCVNGSEFGFAGEFDEIVNTAPNFHGKVFYHPVESFSISAGDDLSAAVGGQALASCAGCIGMRDRTERKYLVAGAAAAPGNYTWDAFRWNPVPFMPPTSYIGDQMKAGGFALEYAGKKSVSGLWETPRLILSFCEKCDDVLSSFFKACYAEKYLPKPHRRRIRDWWRSPIYCTWHDQCAAALIDRCNHIGYTGPAPREFCTEELVEEWLGELISHDCQPGIIILDDKWQLNLNDADPDPEKFADMRQWIEKCHRRNIKVFLWTAAWNKDGIAPDEAITRNGEIVCGDITNPKYEARFREMIRRYFSDAEDGLNADGVKMDGLLSLPTGPGLKNHENLWGLELQKRYLDILYETAHQTKKDVCISTFVAHPYLADTSDMVRLGDMYHSRLSSLRAMKHRAEVYGCAMPYTLIDTDGQFQFSVTDHVTALVGEQMKLGIPTTYNGKLLRQQRFFMPIRYREMTEEDYAVISRAFKIQRKSNGIK